MEMVSSKEHCACAAASHATSGPARPWLPRLAARHPWVQKAGRRRKHRNTPGALFRSPRTLPLRCHLPAGNATKELQRSSHPRPVPCDTPHPITPRDGLSEDPPEDLLALPPSSAPRHHSFCESGPAVHRSRCLDAPLLLQTFRV